MLELKVLANRLYLRDRVWKNFVQNRLLNVTRMAGVIILQQLIHTGWLRLKIMPCLKSRNSKLLRMAWI